MTGASDRARWLRRGLLGLLIVYLIWNSLYYYPSVVDDVFICFRYAANWLAGDGLVFNPGERVEGYSDFLWVALSAGLMAQGVPALAGIKVLGLLSAVGLVFASLALGLRLFGARPGGVAAAYFAAALLCLNTSVAFWSQAGLEPVFYALLLVTSCLRFEIELERGRAFPLSAVLFGLAWMTRPETPVYGLYFLWRRFEALARHPWRRGDGVWLIAVAAIVVPYELWGLVYYGSLLPNTHTAKLGGSRLHLLNALANGSLGQSLLAKFVADQGLGFSALLGAGTIGCVVGRRRLPKAVWLPTLAGFVFVVYAWRDWMPRYRLFVPILPFLFLSISFGLWELYARLRYSRWSAAAFGLACAAALASYVNYQAFGAYRGPRGIRPNAGEARGSWFLDVPGRVGHVLPAHVYEAQTLLLEVPEHEVIAIGNVGLVGYLTMNPIWDVYGLASPLVARARDASDSIANEAMFEDLAATRPGALLLYRWPDGHASMDTRVERWMDQHPEFAALYERRERVGRQTLYLRRDLSEVDTASRFESARSRLTHTGLDQPR